ncbi:Signal peptide peptidase-like 2A [Actinomortierella ambigua]|nr:Signal peptide peptidase-like 2A [Actinomortierella ambigua]
MSNMQMATWVVSQLVSDPLLPLAGLAVTVLTLSAMAAANTTPQERTVQRQLEAKGEAIALEAKHTIVFLAAATTGLLSMWMFPNFLRFSITMMLTLFKPTTLSTPVLLLSAAFVYDVFFVFGTPYLTSTGESIMEAAATGAALTVNEAIPMLFRMPSRGDAGGGEAVLGFGDVVLPGILVTFLRESDARLAQAYQEKLDKKQGDSSYHRHSHQHQHQYHQHLPSSPFSSSSPLLDGPVWSVLWSMLTTGWRRRHPALSAIPSVSNTGNNNNSNVHHPHPASPTVGTWTYYAIAIAWFGIGLQVTFVAMMLSGKGQPALLYLVPCTVLPVIYTAYRRGELSQLWHGWDDGEDLDDDLYGDQEEQQPEQQQLMDSFCSE